VLLVVHTSSEATVGEGLADYSIRAKRPSAPALLLVVQAATRLRTTTATARAGEAGTASLPLARCETDVVHGVGPAFVSGRVREPARAS
jgi:hypothetical protein